MMELKSRMQILNELSVKIGQRVEPAVENFEDFCMFFDQQARVQLVYQAMLEYNNQSSLNQRAKKRELYSDEKLEEMMIDTMRDKWAHCFYEGRLFQRPENFERELKYKMEGAKMMLLKLCHLPSDSEPFNIEDYLNEN
jgi:hypothetical protein